MVDQFIYKIFSLKQFSFMIDDLFIFRFHFPIVVHTSVSKNVCLLLTSVMVVMVVMWIVVAGNNLNGHSFVLYSRKICLYELTDNRDGDGDGLDNNFRVLHRPQCNRHEHHLYFVMI